MRNNHKGFTLIELLVVISIISLLSSIVLAAVSTARDKGRVAGGLEFSAHTLSAYGADAEGVWNLDEGSGVTINDLAARHPGTFSASPLPTWSTDTPSGKGYSLNFASGAYITLANSLSTPTANITITAWVKTTSANDMAILSLRGGGNIYFGMTGGRMYVYINNSSAPSMISKATINDGKWHNIAWTANGTNDVMYIDGVVDSTSVRTNTAIPTIANAYIGKDVEYNSPFVGSLDNVSLYTQSLLSP